MSEGKSPSQLAERFQIRMSEGLRDRLREVAEASGRSMNSEILSRLEDSLDFAEPIDLDRVSQYLKKFNASLIQINRIGTRVELLLRDEFYNLDALIEKSAASRRASGELKKAVGDAVESGQMEIDLAERLLKAQWEVSLQTTLVMKEIQKLNSLSKNQKAADEIQAANDSAEGIMKFYKELEEQYKAKATANLSADLAKIHRPKEQKE